jgi:hypothetical protein
LHKRKGYDPWGPKERDNASCRDFRMSYTRYLIYDGQINYGRDTSVITRSEFLDIVKLEGHVRGSTLNTDAAFVKSREGRGGLNKVEECFQNLGYPVEYKHIQDMGWYPLCVRVLSLRTIQDVLELKDEEMVTMGDMAPKFSFLVKVYMKFTNLPEHAFSAIPEYWGMHYTVGKMEVGELNEDAGFMTVRLVDFKIHPVFCRYLEGYFRRLLQFSFVSREVRCWETRCSFADAPYHEYRIAWK